MRNMPIFEAQTQSIQVKPTKKVNVEYEKGKFIDAQEYKITKMFENMELSICVTEKLLLKPQFKPTQFSKEFTGYIVEKIKPTLIECERMINMAYKAIQEGKCSNTSELKDYMFNLGLGGAAGYMSLDHC